MDGSTGKAYTSTSTSANHAEHAMENPWNYVSDIHASHVIEAINELRKNKELCDVILVVDGHCIPAHRLILSACSPYFHGLFEGPCHNAPSLGGHPIEVPLSGIDASAAEHAIDYCYTSHLVIDDDNVWSLLPAASLLQLEEVQNVCCDFLKGRLNLSNCVRMRVMAATCHCEELTQISENFILKEFQKVICGDEFLTISADNLASFLAQAHLTENQVYQAVNTWLNKDKEYRTSDLTIICQRLPWIQEFFPVNSRGQGQNANKPDVPSNQMTNEREEAGYAECPVCRLLLHSPQQLHSHMVEQHNDTGAKVYGCMKTTKATKILAPNRQPKSDQIADEDPDLICQICSKHYHSDFEMTNHCLGHMEGFSPAPDTGSMATETDSLGPTEDEASNTSLEYTVSSSTDDFLRSYKGEKHFMCKICSKETVNEKEMYAHCSDFHGNSNPPLDCSLCHKLLKDKPKLVRHLVNHATIVTFCCPLCDKQSRTKANLQIHMRIHTGERPFICNFCKKGFRNYCVLKVHIRSHTGEKPYDCHLCPQSFTKNIHLKRHISTHSGEKPYSCDTCGKGFGRNDHLQRHIKTIHTREKPHACTLCGKDFFRRYELDRHMRHHMKKSESQTKTNNSNKSKPNRQHGVPLDNSTPKKPRKNPPSPYNSIRDSISIPYIPNSSTISSQPKPIESYYQTIPVPTSTNLNTTEMQTGVLAGIAMANGLKPLPFQSRPELDIQTYTVFDKVPDNCRFVSSYPRNKPPITGDENFNVSPNPALLETELSLTSDPSNILPFSCT